MKKLKTYHSFNDKGECYFPSVQEINDFEKNGFHPILLLDSCVCLDLIKFVNYKKKSQLDKAKLKNYLEYIKKHKIETISMFGLLELCHDPKTMEFDINKFWEFNNKIDFIEKIPMNYVNSYRFDFDRDYIVTDLNEFETNSIIAFRPLLLTTYCCLLKIREISFNGLEKSKAIKNIETFRDWLINELDISMAIEYHLAMNIFGGISELRKMICIDTKKHDVKKILWGTSWDIFHSRINGNNAEFSGYFGEKIYSTFITNDSNLFKLISKISLEAIFLNSENNSSTSMIVASNELPHFEPAFIDESNSKMKNIFSNRLLIKKQFNESKILEMIEKLEYSNNVAER
ncbi:MAG TPA: hypothetical protein DCG75_04525 [Bacteroidales bacterium]|nr:hypothetical protein [Bacteroidales bacterium]